MKLILPLTPESTMEATAAKVPLKTENTAAINAQAIVMIKILIILCKCPTPTI
jgi:hypothetical protein